MEEECGNCWRGQLWCFRLESLARLAAGVALAAIHLFLEFSMEFSFGTVERGNEDMLFWEDSLNLEGMERGRR